MDIFNQLLILNLCDRQSVVNILYLVGIVLMAIKIIVPIILIVIGTADLFKSMTQDKEASEKALSQLIKKAVAAIIIFLIPTFINITLTIIEEDEEWRQCEGCILNPFDCTYDINN